MQNFKFDRRKRIFVLVVAMVILTLMMTMYFAFAESDIIPEKKPVNDEIYLYWKLQHNLSDAGYKYYGYGYTVSVTAPGGHVVASDYLENSEFNPQMDGSVEKVEMPMRVLLTDKLHVPEDYLSVKDLTLYLNARMGIKKNDVVTFAYDSYDGSSELGMPYLDTGTVDLGGRTVPLNKDGKGIVNGIEEEYGVSWSPITKINLNQHFGIKIELDDPIIPWDRYKVEYREVGTEKSVNNSTEYVDYGMNKTVTEYPVTVNGYEYASFYKIDKIDSSNVETPGAPTEGDSATVNLMKNADRYIITFYYNKIDPSQIGKPITVEVEYREDTSTGEKLLNNKNMIGGELSQFNLNSEKIDGYICKGHYVMGQATEYFYNTNASFIIGKEQYSKPVNGKLKIIFLYEKEEAPEIPKCTPDINGSSEAINITMKRKDFENATEISINNAALNIKKFEAGKDNNGNTVEGTHLFKYFDLYVGSGTYYYMSHDNNSKSVNASFIIPKSIFTQSAANENIYTTSIKVTYGGFCTCFNGPPDSNGNYGMEFDYNNLNVNITIVENYPPNALYTFYTEKKLISGKIDKINNAYINRETIFENRADDLNGVDDIKYIKYTLKDSSNNEYYIKLLQLGSGVYFLDDDNVNANNIVFNGATDEGNIKLKFLTDETWIISQYVEDTDGLNDTYTKEITPEILDLRPKAIISDATGYRYPIGAAFNGKQNRVVKYHSNNSKVAEFLQGTGVEINHNRDSWEIIPMENQDIDKIYFENFVTNMSKIDNVIQIKYNSLNNTKLQFSQSGKYKIRLQVTDTNGNVSEWTEEVITINKDLDPKVTANINTTYYRNTSGISSITIKNISPMSLDGDYVFLEGTDKIIYKYDSDNDGSFTDEISVELKLINNGSTYETTLPTSNLGKYQFMINVRETFGQEYLEEFITENDYKKSGATLQTHVDNIEPDVTTFKIMTIEN